MSLSSDFTYLNTAATGLVPASYLKAVTKFQQELSTNASKANESWYAEQLGELRKSAAEFLDAELNEVAFVPNFSYGLNALVHSLNPGLRVMVLYEDYPSLIDPFKLNNFEVQRVKSSNVLHFNTEDIMVELMARNIQVLAISHVQWLSGFKVNLEVLCRFCRERGILTIVDATQSMGAIPLSLKESQADVIIGSNYKWMNAGFGSGILCARRDFLEANPPRIRGNNSRMLVGNKWTDNASVVGYEPGHLNIPGLIALHRAIEDKLHTGVERIHKHNMQLTDELIGTLNNDKVKLVGPESMDQRSSIVLLRGGDELFHYLSKNGFVVSLRNNLVRISFHYHNTLKEAEELVRVLNAYSPA